MALVVLAALVALPVQPARWGAMAEPEQRGKMVLMAALPNLETCCLWPEAAMDMLEPLAIEGIAGPLPMQVTVAMAALAVLAAVAAVPAEMAVLVVLGEVLMVVHPTAEEMAVEVALEEREISAAAAAVVAVALEEQILILEVEELEGPAAPVGPVPVAAAAVAAVAAGLER